MSGSRRGRSGSPVRGRDTDRSDDDGRSVAGFSYRFPSALARPLAQGVHGASVMIQLRTDAATTVMNVTRYRRIHGAGDRTYTFVLSIDLGSVTRVPL